jgi:signal peptidase I
MSLLLGCGWGLLGLSFWLTSTYSGGTTTGLVLAAAVSLGLFLLLERNHLLSRLLGLQINPAMPWWVSALLLWALGVVVLLFRPTATRTAPALADAEARGRPQPDARTTDSTREIVETVVFVVVLVLLLKSFAAEAFVIPTGSMAQTLLGYQKIVECPQCGLEFPVNCSTEADPSEGAPAPVTGCTCPNCRQHIKLVYSVTTGSWLTFDRRKRWVEVEQRVPAEGGQWVHPERPPPNGINEVANPGWGSGDRVLVAKFVYDLLDRLPERLDVVVFKFPGDDKFPGESGPVKKHTPMNYIKRLIGLPGETIAICQGKLYCLSPDKLSPEKRALYQKDLEAAGSDPNKLSQLWRKTFMHQDDAASLFEEGKFRIVRKSPANLLAMRRLVYDNDHPAKDLTGPEWERWVSAESNGWAADGKRGFKSDPAEEGERWLRYRHVLRDSKDQKPQLITDFMGYNTWAGRGHSSPGENWVSDLLLECDATVERPQGELTLELSRGPDRFQAAFDLKTGRCTLYRLTGPKGERQELGSAETRLNRKGTYRLRFADVDERLTVWVDGRLPFDDGVVYQPAPKLVPTAENDLERPASVGARGAAVAVSKLKLFRDTYYTTAKGSPGAPDLGNSFRPEDPSTYAWRDVPVSTFYVQPGHFLCMGDNSPESSDGRSWGLVPQRLMLGRALLVYWPVGRAGRIR